MSGNVTIYIYKYNMSFVNKWNSWETKQTSSTPLFSALYIVVLFTSACCCGLLKPASHAPALFHHNTNLQQLLDLRSNLSAQGISCHMCSGETRHWGRYVSHFLPFHSYYLRGALPFFPPQVLNNALVPEGTKRQNKSGMNNSRGVVTSL